MPNNRLLPIILIFVSLLLAVGPSSSGYALDTGTITPLATPLSGTTVYLPLVQTSDSFSLNAAIWSHDSNPAAHETVLFRHTFTLTETVTSTKIQIFADTRYEIWLDGDKIGRGPARFSHDTREYDCYDLETLPVGEHLIAVLVQWAPNMRRSESVTPFLQASIKGTTAQGLRTVVTQTSSEWRALPTSAWQAEAELLHAWQLIGPTELLDLRQLPWDWMQPTFSAERWPPAVIKIATVPPATYQPRSISFLSQVPMSVYVRETGVLSPNKAVVELVPPIAQSYELPISALDTTELVLETLDSSNNTNIYQSDDFRPNLWQPRAVREQQFDFGLTENIVETELVTARLDGVLLEWQNEPPRHPDVRIATRTIAPGDHTLLLADLPAEGLTFSLSANIEATALPFQQGLHAGRRLLLAELVSQPSAVTVSGSNKRFPTVNRADGSRRSGPGWNEANDTLPAEPRNVSLDLQFNDTPAYAVLDLGRVVHGRVVADVTGPTGTVIDMGWDERLWEDSRPLPYPGSFHKEWNQTDSWILDGSTRAISTLDARSGRYILIAVWGDEPVHLSHLRVKEERYPVVQQGSFLSSDTRLNEIWQVGVDTLYPNMTDAYTDTPWRERGQWWGDAYVAWQSTSIVSLLGIPLFCAED